MKILEAQAAAVSNFEVYQHVKSQQRDYKRAKRRGPPNLETVIRETIQYLERNPSPLSQRPTPYRASSIATLIQRLAPYDLSKGETLMMLNLRPASVAALNTIVEDMSERYSEEQQEEMVGIIAEVLGQFEPPEAAPEENGGDEGDVDMAEAGTS